MTTLQERFSQAFYGAGSSAPSSNTASRQPLTIDRDKLRALQQPPLQVISRAEAGKLIYGSPYGPALDSFYGLGGARLGGDRDLVDMLRSSRQPLGEFLGKKTMRPDHAQTLLSTGLHYLEKPRTPEQQEEMGKHTFDSLRREHGTKEAEAIVARHRNFMDELRGAVPDLCTQFEVNGLHCDPNVLRITSQYGK